MSDNSADSAALAKRIRAEMTTSRPDALTRCFDVAKRHVSITENGMVIVSNKDKLGAKSQILLYLIGKLYAKEAGLCGSSGVTNEELGRELGLTGSSLRPRLMELKESKKIVSSKSGRTVFHTIYQNIVEKTIREIDEEDKPKAKAG
jgi:hypothetical protein